MEFIRDTVPVRLYRCWNKLGSRSILTQRVMWRAGIASTARNSTFFGMLILGNWLFEISLEAGGVAIVGFGAVLIAYTAVRTHTSSLEKISYAPRRNGRFKDDNNRQIYCRSISVFDAFYGVVVIIVGFSIQFFAHL